MALVPCVLIHDSQLLESGQPDIDILVCPCRDWVGPETLCQGKGPWKDSCHEVALVNHFRPSSCKCPDHIVLAFFWNTFQDRPSINVLPEVVVAPCRSWNEHVFASTVKVIFGCKPLKNLSSLGTLINQYFRSRISP